MSRLSLINTAFIFFMLVGLQSCTSDSSDAGDTEVVKKPEITVANNLHHKWEASTAIRDGKATASLEGLFFDFSAIDTLTTNLMGSPQKLPYQLQGNAIQQLGDNPITYTVAKIEADLMVLEMTLNETPFQFNLRKMTADNQ